MKSTNNPNRTVPDFVLPASVLSSLSEEDCSDLYPVGVDGRYSDDGAEAADLAALADAIAAYSDDDSDVWASGPSVERTRIGRVRSLCEA